MSFDDIPEDLQESYPCERCSSGSVTKDADGWSCDSCDFGSDSGNGMHDENRPTGRVNQ